MFPDRMVALMKQKKITKKQICADVGIGINQIKYWETNHNIPDADVVQKIADYLGTNASYLLELGTEHDFLQSFAKEKDPPLLQLAEEAGRKAEALAALGGLVDQLTNEQVEELRKYAEFLASKNKNPLP